MTSEDTITWGGFIPTKSLCPDCGHESELGFTFEFKRKTLQPIDGWLECSNYNGCTHQDIQPTIEDIDCLLEEGCWEDYLRDNPWQKSVQPFLLEMREKLLAQKMENNASQ